MLQHLQKGESKPVLGKPQLLPIPKDPDEDIDWEIENIGIPLQIYRPNHKGNLQSSLPLSRHVH